MKSKITWKQLAKLIFIASLLPTLLIFLFFQENITENISSLKSKYLQHSQLFTNISIYSSLQESLAKFGYSKKGQVVNVTNISVADSTPKPSTSLTQQSFANLMRSFPWIPYKKTTFQGDIPEIKKYSELLLTSILIPFITKEPPTPVNTSCKAPPLPSKPDKCTLLKDGTTRKIGVILNFSFDVDALEVHLHELNSLVDRFFLMEGTKVNSRFLDGKPSVWDLVKYTPRFSQFQSKVVHFIVDDADYRESTSRPMMWSREVSQGKLRLKKFLLWNEATGHFSSDDWIGIGDTDEIPSRQAINVLKKCEVNGDESGGVNIGIWFPVIHDDNIFRTDFPVRSHPYTLGNPTYWKVSAVGKIFRSGTSTGRRMGTGNTYLLGGMHFSDHPYLPFQLTKLMTATENAIDSFKFVIEIGMTYLNGSQSHNADVDTAALKKWKEAKLRHPAYKGRIESLKAFRNMFGDQEADDIIKIPWFYQCNLGRYPGYRSKPDERLL